MGYFHILSPHDYDNICILHNLVFSVYYSVFLFNICMSIHPMTKVTGILDILNKFLSFITPSRPNRTGEHVNHPQFFLPLDLFTPLLNALPTPLAISLMFLLITDITLSASTVSLILI